MLQDQHTKQITQIEATNKANMETMMEKFSALVALNKENTPPGGNIKPPGGGNQVKNPRKKKTLCPNCKCFVLHKP